MNTMKSLSALNLASEGLLHFLKLRQKHTPEDVAKVVALLRTSNPELLDWVKEVLS